MALAFTKLAPHFAALVGPIDLRASTIPRRSPRSGRGWTSTPSWSSATSRSPTPSSSTSPSAWTASSTPRRDRAPSTRAGSGTRPSRTSPTSTRTARSSRATTAGACTAWATACGTPTRPSRTPPGRYSMLSARVIPPVGADTEFADMRAAYDALPPETKDKLEGLRVHHSIAHSRQTLGFQFSESEQEALKGAVHPLIRAIPRSNRKSLYLASHASRIIDWPVPEGRLLLHELIEHATQRGVRVPPRVARRRSRHLGQPRHHAPRAPVRRRPAPPRAPPGHHARPPSPGAGGQRVERLEGASVAPLPSGEGQGEGATIRRSARGLPHPGLLPPREREQIRPEKNVARDGGGLRHRRFDRASAVSLYSAARWLVSSWACCAVAPARTPSSRRRSPRRCARPRDRRRGPPDGRAEHVTRPALGRVAAAAPAGGASPPSP